MIGPAYLGGLREALDSRYPEGTTYVEDDAHDRTVAVLPDGRAQSWVVEVVSVDGARARLEEDGR